MSTTSQSDFPELMAQVRNGCEDAVRELLERYGDHIFSAVRRRMNDKMRTQFDSEDFCQAVWKSFFANRDEMTERFENAQELIVFLKKLAKNKVIDEYRRGQRKGKGYEQEKGVGSFRFILEETTAQYAAEATPSEVISYEEEVDRLLGEESAMLQDFVEMRMNGSTFSEIAQKYKLSDRTVRRAFQKLGQRFLEIMD